MTRKNNTFIYGILAVIVLLIFLLILYFLGRENSQPATINDKVTGFYSSAPINNRCSIAPITDPTTLLPTFNLPQNCSENYTCVQNGTPDNPFGYCKVPITENTELSKIYNCNTVYDCAPPTNPNEIVYCNGVCQTTTLSNWNSKSPKTYGGLYSYCDFNTPCNSGLICSNILDNFSNSYGECLIENGGALTCENGVEQGCCSSDEQCINGKCDFNRGEGIYGLCINKIAPAEICDINYCQQGFGCDFSQIDSFKNLCQILGTSGPAQYGKINSFCVIGTQSGSGDYMSCDSGLVCNFDLSINGIPNYSPSLYPTLSGYGVCSSSKNALNESCNGLNNSCEEPLVCYNGTCITPSYLLNDSPPSLKNTVVEDINYCGPEYISPSVNYDINGSSGACLNGYTCVNTGMTGLLSQSKFCVGNPETSTYISLCNSGTNAQTNYYGNFCGSVGNGAGCGGRYIGVFIQGVWKFLELPNPNNPLYPSGYTINANSKISVYQYVPTSGSNQDYPVTRIIFYPNSNKYGNNPYFYYTEFSSYEINPSGANILKFSPSWELITIQPYKNPISPSNKIYINSGAVATNYDNTLGTFTRVGYQLVGGGAGGGAGNSVGENRGGGGGGSGYMVGYLGGIDGSNNYNLVSRPNELSTLLPANWKVSVSLGTGGSGGMSDGASGFPGNATIIDIYDNTVPVLPVLLYSITSLGGLAGDTGDNSRNGNGGDGFNGGGGGENFGGSSATRGLGGIGNTTEGGIDGQDGYISGVDMYGGNGGGVGSGPGGSVGNSVDHTAGGGGAAGSGVNTGSQTGGSGSQNGNAPTNGTGNPNGINYTGAGGGGGSYFGGVATGGNGGTGYAILEFYNEANSTLNEVYDIKFSPSGNIAMFLNETSPIFDPVVKGNDNSLSPTTGTYNRIYLVNFGNMNTSTGILTYTPSVYGPLFTTDDPSSIALSNIGNLTINSSSSYYNSDTFVWDVDDLYNNSIVAGFKNGTNMEFWSASIPTSSNGLQDLDGFTTKTVVPILSSYPNYVKYFIDFKYSSSTLNFLYNYNTGGTNNITINTASSSTPYVVDIELGSPLTYAMSFSKYGTLNNFVFYYMAESGEIRQIISSRDKTGVVSFNETDIYGYAPVEIIVYDNTKSQMMALTSMTNIDNSLYALVETCV